MPLRRQQGGFDYPCGLYQKSLTLVIRQAMHFTEFLRQRQVSNSALLQHLNAAELIKEYVHETAAVASLAHILDSRPLNPDASVCSYIFLENDLIYHCRTCTDDETCVMCQSCFNRSFHENHSYSYYISRASGGCCDCGEDESWKRDIECHIHRSKASSVALCDESFDTMRGVLAGAAEYIASALPAFPESSSDGAAGSKFSLVLFNDEKHSFDEVIFLLSRYLLFSTEIAKEHAELIDIHGFASIYISSDFSKCQQNQKFIQIGGLECGVYAVDTVSKALIVEACIDIIAVCCSSGSSQVIDLVFGLLLQDSAEGSLLQLLFKHEYRLWKKPRKLLQNVLTKLSLHSVQHKLSIARQFFACFPAILENHLLEVREPQLTILHFMVQLFSTPTVISVLVYEHQFFHKVFDFLLHNLCNPSGHLIERSYRFCFQALAYALCDSRIKSQKITLDDRLSKQVFQLLAKAKSFDPPVLRQLGDHILYEDDSWIGPFNFLLTLGKFISGFCALVSNHSALLDGIQLCGDDRAPSDIKSLRVSLYRPDLLLLSHAISRQQLSSGSHYAVSSAVFAECLELLITHQQISGGHWVRNGSNLHHQHTLVFSPPFASYFLFPVRFLVQEYFSDPSFAWAELCAHFPLESIFSNLGCDFSWIFAKEFVANIVTALGKQPHVIARAENAIRTCSNFLCVGSCSYSELISRIPHPYDEQLDAVLPEIATGASSSHGVVQFSINAASAFHFTPFFWMFSLTQRDQAVQYMSKRGLFSWTHFFEKLVPSSCPVLCLPQFHRILSSFLQHALFSRKDVFASQNGLFLLMSAIRCGIMAESVFNDLFKRLLLAGVRTTDFLSERPMFLCILECFSINLPDCGESPAGMDEAKRRKQDILGRMREQQKQFLLSNETAGSSTANALAHVEKCICCLEFFHLSEGVHGTMVYMQQSSILKKNHASFSEQFLRGSFISTCGHSIHLSCFKKLQPFYGKLRRCPLCSKPASHVFANSELGLGDASELDQVSKSLLLSNVQYSILRDAFVYTAFASCLSPGIEKQDKASDLLKSLSVLLAEARARASTIDVSNVRYFAAFQKVVDVFSGGLDGFEATRDAIAYFNSQPEHVSTVYMQFLEVLCNFWAAETPRLSQIRHLHLELFMQGLIPLVKHYDELYTSLNRQACSNCKRRPQEPALCLNCGTVLCARSTCCSRPGSGECFSHIRRCGGVVGVYLMLKKCALVFLFESSGWITKAPFLTKHGEFDFGLKMATPLYLSGDLYDSIIRDYLNHRLLDRAMRDQATFLDDWRYY